MARRFRTIILRATLIAFVPVPALAAQDARSPLRVDLGLGAQAGETFGPGQQGVVGPAGSIRLWRPLTAGLVVGAELDGMLGFGSTWAGEVRFRWDRCAVPLTSGREPGAPDPTSICFARVEQRVALPRVSGMVGVGLRQRVHGRRYVLWVGAGPARSATIIEAPDGTSSKSSDAGWAARIAIAPATGARVAAPALAVAMWRGNGSTTVAGELGVRLRVF